MWKIREFKCESGHEFEDMVEDSIHSLPCPECGTSAIRILSAVAAWDNSPAAKDAKLKKRSVMHSQTKQAKEEARHNYEKVMGRMK